MLYILYGDDDFSVNESLEQIRKSIGAAELRDANTSVFDASALVAEELKAICNTVPFLSEKRLVIVRGLMERFQPKTGGVPQKASPGKKKEDGYKTFVDSISNIPQSTVLVLLDRNVKNGNRLLQAIKSGATMHAFPLKRGRLLTQWIQNKVQTAGGSISPQAINLLARLVGSNLWIMSNEVQKLTLFAGGRRIEEEDVLTLVASAREFKVFHLIDAILEKRSDTAEELLQHLLKSGEAHAYLLFMLARQLQIIVRMKALRENNRPKAEIQGKLGLTAEFLWQKAVEQSVRYDMPRIKEIYERLLATDLAIKTGKYDGETALIILIAELCGKDR
ncbi:MAG: DNA polymerase III subunit delta [Chloroflexota bacterium]